MRSCLFTMLCFLVGMMIVDIIRTGGMTWETIGYYLTPIILFVLLRLGFNLYKKKE